MGVLDDLALNLGEPHAAFTFDDLERMRGPIVYVWTRGDEVLYVGMSFKGMERPLASNHEKLRHFRAGDLLTIWRAGDDNPYELEADLIHRFLPRMNGATHCGECRRAHAEAAAWRSFIDAWAVRAWRALGIV